MPQKEKDQNQNEGFPEYKSYEHDLFRLSEQDFVSVGCTQEELGQVREWNEKLKETDEKKKRQEELSKEEKDARRAYEEKLYLTFLKAADRNPTRWEYAGSRLPNWVQSTGNVSVQNQILRTYGDQLPVADKVRLLKRRMATMKAKQIAKDLADDTRSQRLTRKF